MKILKRYFWSILLCILLVILVGLMTGLFMMSSGSEVKKTIVGAIFINDVNDGGWNQYHYEGLKTACDTLGLKLEIVTDVAEGSEAAGAAVDELVGKGCNVIFLTSEGYGMDMYPVMDKYNTVQFYTVSSNSNKPNAITYFCRLYEMRYLSGIIAGKMTKSNILGYVAGSSNPQTTRGINAYALGARSVNPDVTVKVRYLDTWTDALGEYDAAKKLIEEDGADVITYHVSLNTALDAADERGVYTIGYGMDNDGYSDKYLTSVTYKWDVVYEYILGDFLRGVFPVNDYYFMGMRDNAVSMGEYSSIIPEDVKLLVEEEKQKLKKGSFVFEGKIVSNTGKEKCRQGERISDDALLQRMDWFVEGVEIYD